MPQIRAHQLLSLAQITLHFLFSKIQYYAQYDLTLGICYDQTM